LSICFRKYGQYSFIGWIILYVFAGLFLCIFFLLQYKGETRQAESNLSVKINENIANINAHNLWNTVLHLQAYGDRSTWEKQWETALWISSQLEQFGLEVSLPTYEFNGKIWPNVFAKVKGEGKGSEALMLIAHLDSISRRSDGIAPGADDDASGIAVLLEIARISKELDLNRTLMFGIFSNEEVGKVGSRNYASSAKKQGLNIKAVINLDILGYNRPKFPFYYFNAVLAQGTWKHKAKSVIRMTQNFFSGIKEGKDMIKVAGRKMDRDLVETISNTMRESANLRIKQVVQDDCV
jgi:hypothetical protein